MNFMSKVAAIVGATVAVISLLLLDGRFARSFCEETGWFCQEETATPLPTHTPATPSLTPQPTYTPYPTLTPLTPTYTPLPTLTPQPTYTPYPTLTPLTPALAYSAAASAAPLSTPMNTAVFAETPIHPPTKTAAPPTDTPIPPTARPRNDDGSCDNAPRPQLKPGDTALQLGSKAIKLRSQPNFGSEDRRRVYQMQRVTILSQAVCRDGYHFYEVRTEAGARGWVVHAESRWDSRKSWLVRVDDGRDCLMEPRLVAGHKTEMVHHRRIKLREAPDLSAPETGHAISRGTKVRVLAGPVCADAFVWYKLETLAREVLGWAQQGGGGKYFFAEDDGYEP